MKITTAAALIAALVVPSTALAESPYCMPKNGKHRFPKTGSTCPTGYFASGRCCEAFHVDTPDAVPMIDGKACPPGTFRSGGACKAFR
jgi:hypothetical protein